MIVLESGLRELQTMSPPWPWLLQLGGGLRINKVMTKKRKGYQSSIKLYIGILLYLQLVLYCYYF